MTITTLRKVAIIVCVVTCLGIVTIAVSVGVPDAGAGCFGLVVGWVTYRTLRRDGSGAHISDIAAVIGAVGGSTVTNVISEKLFGWYSIGLAVGFFLYYIISVLAADIGLSANKKRELAIGKNEEVPP